MSSFHYFIQAEPKAKSSAKIVEYEWCFASDIQWGGDDLSDTSLASMPERWFFRDISGYKTFDCMKDSILNDFEFKVLRHHYTNKKNRVDVILSSFELSSKKVTQCQI